MDRHLARAQETFKIASAMRGWVDQLQTGGAVYTPSSPPLTAASYGLTEAPRGALGHWLQISNGKDFPLPGRDAHLLERLPPRQRRETRPD